MYGRRAKLWLRFFLLSFGAMIAALTVISMALYHNTVWDGLQGSFIPSIGSALIFSMVVFLRPQT
ncbi:hypothetical protein KXQ82_10590 [Mucilaginibacter sp. HMF5004]|uniref:hypothetical protein n=1 Tax=Mucilaginibacter rivuli TaxID=2857527 RepID=UPI001C5EF6D0|nr:hypothetical protein [Mucilaginibacter rivuli]MBW4890167.1 hypothetical protein [Mucilaginibacter rivuli]